MDRKNIDKISQSPEDRLLLARLWDKINSGVQKNIPSNTGFLSPREQELAQYLFGDAEGIFAFGGYDEAERKMLVYLPDYCEEGCLWEDDSPIYCLRSEFYQEDTLTHRDFLGALIGCGIDRSCIGDICVGKGRCDFFVTAEIAPYLLQNFTSAGRVKLRLKQIPLCDAHIPDPEFFEIRDTLASVRLDSVISSGFRISRSQAADAICAGKAAVDGIPCEKPDKPVAAGAKISLRGMGKIKLESIGGVSRKGRTCVVIYKYV